MRKSSLPERVKRGISEPHLVVRELNKYFYRRRGPSADAIDLLQADWDNLLLLDACDTTPSKLSTTCPENSNPAAPWRVRRSNSSIAPSTART